jgi:hypothetical protein
LLVLFVLVSFEKKYSVTEVKWVRLVAGTSLQQQEAMEPLDS